MFRSLSSVSDKAYSIREGMKTAEQRMKELQKLMEYGRNYQTYKPIQEDVYKRQYASSTARSQNTPGMTGMLCCGTTTIINGMV